MILVAQSVPTATAVPCVAAVPAGWTLAEITVDDGETSFAFDSDIAGSHAIEVSLLPPGECRDRRRHRGAERRGRRAAASSGSISSGPRSAGRAPTGTAGGCVTVRLRARHAGTAPPVLFDADIALGLPARARRSCARSTTAPVSRCAVPRRRRAREVSGERSAGGVRAAACSSGVVVLVVVAIVTTAALAAPPRHPARVGRRADRRRGRVDDGGGRRARTRRLGLGRRRLRARRRSAIGIPATMAVAVTLDLLARPGSLATGERGRPRRRAAARCGRCRNGSPCSGATASSCAWRASRASGRCSRRRTGPSTRPTRSGSACAGCSSRRVAST